MRILIDMDNVLADFNKAVVAAFDGYGFKRSPQKFMAAYDVTEWYEYEASEMKILFNDLMHSDGFWAGLDIMPGAVEGLAALLENNHELCVVSTLWWSSPCCAIEKWQWISANLKDLIDPLAEVIFAASKFLIEGDILIDDSTTHISQWLKLPNHKAIVFDCPYNQVIVTEFPREYYRAYEWDEVVPIIKKIERQKRDG